MNMSLDCLPCILRQSLDVVRLATADPEQQEIIMQKLLRILAEFSNYDTAPRITRDIHRLVKQLTDNPDPYRQMKAKHIEEALSVLPKIRSYIAKQPDPLLAALKAGAFGNLIDAAIFTDIDIAGQVAADLNKPLLINDIDMFKNKLKSARTLLMLGDNAGESVFDRLLLEQLPSLKIYYAVKSLPIINDATATDAIASGLADLARIVASGCDSPGIILDDANDDFLEIFWQADIIVSKGQGNFEGLSDCRRDIFFLLTAKCDMVADFFAVAKGSALFVYHEGGPDRYA